MQKESRTISAEANREIVLTRILNAPRELVFEAWTNPEHLKHWWGPTGFTLTTTEMDVRPGGVWKHIMHGPDGTDYTNKSRYVEVVKPERLVYEHSGGKKDGPAVKFQATVTFEDLGRLTKLTLRMVFHSEEELKKVVEVYGAIEGGKQTLGRLEAHLYSISSDRTFVITRDFNAPRDLVFKMWTEEKHLAHWWGPKGFSINVNQLDLQPGGVFHYSMQSKDGHTMWGKFVYREIAVPARIVFVNSFSDADGNIAPAPFDIPFPLEVLNILTLTEKDGKTTLTLKGGPINATAEQVKAYNSLFESMQQGFGGTFDQLEEYLAKA